MSEDRKNKPVKVTWECGKCGSVQESYSHKRWEMDVCECGASGYDLEPWYARTMGPVVFIKSEPIEED